MNCFKFFGLAAIGMLTMVGSAFAQIPGTFVGATAGAGGNTTLVDGGEFATATGDEEGMWYDGSNTTGDGSRSLRTADGTSQIADSGGFRPFEIRVLGTPILDSQIVTVIDGLTAGVTYDINVIYTAQWGGSDFRLAAGLTTTTTQVEGRPQPPFEFGSWLDEGSEYNPSAEVGGSGPNASARVWFTNLGTAVADTNGEIRVYIDNISSPFISEATAYNGVSFSEVTDSCVLGDVDQSGVVDFLDIGPFIAILSAGGFQCEADIDGSSAVDFLDIGPFIALLSGA